MAVLFHFIKPRRQPSYLRQWRSKLIAKAILQVFSTSSKYFLYRYFEDQNWKYSNKVIYAIAGGGVITSLISHPVDAIKIHLQMNTSFWLQFKQLGPKIFYRGYNKT